MTTRKTLLRLMTGALCILLGVGVGLYDYISLKYRKVHVTQEVPSEEEAEEEEYLSTGPTDETLEIKRGDTLSAVLERAGISSDQSTSVIEALKSVFNPRELRPDHELYITYTIPEDDVLKKDLSELYLKIAIDLDVVVERDETGQFIAKKIQKELIQEQRVVEGQIEGSLYVDANNRGAHPKIIAEMIAAFSYDIDFQRGIQPGDTYGIFYEVHKEPESLQEKPGELRYAYLKCNGRVYKIYRFKSKNGTYQYYNERGESVKKGLMRTPIDGARLSSGFGKRHHPILGYTKMHKGVDFAAPIGTPVMAAGDGRIEKIGPFSSYGNYILIRHSGPYATAYAHLCRFARGLKCGVTVRQGQIIGYVGRTGRATGPHLHYELIKAGVQINPKSIQMLPAGKLKDKDMQDFMVLKVSIDQQYTTNLQQQNTPQNVVKQIEEASEEVTEDQTQTPSKS
jgi:murein DD-endopeptidase MepM/ murein hydrolase activator NlpD